MNWKLALKTTSPIALLVLSGCATVAQAEADGSNVRLGQTAMVNGPRIKPVAILEDSRCPMNARCIWAGRVRLKMIWLRPKGNQMFEVTLGEPVQLADGQFSLTAVHPEKRTDRPIGNRDYRFSFDFQGGL